ncbi:MAG: LysM peptidoglycan-binding domain-containing protein [Verrucomicrobia bacterium]|nr:LysM peptidoglycan-binding domain-containing protein [Verrucomicrobiota bacterium]
MISPLRTSIFFLFAGLLLGAGGCRNYQGSDAEEKRHPDLVEAAELMQRQDLEGAIALCKERLRKDPDFAYAHLMLGTMYQTRRNPVSAIYHFERYLEKRGGEEGAEKPQTAIEVERMIQRELIRIVDNHPSVRAMQPPDVIELRDELDAVRAELDARKTDVARLNLELEQARRRNGERRGGDAGGESPTAAELARLETLERELAEVRREKQRLQTRTQTGGGTETRTSSSEGASESASRTYTVRSGDNLSVISQRVYNTPHRWREIQDANPNVNPNRLRIGQTLVIP